MPRPRRSYLDYTHDCLLSTTAWWQKFYSGNPLGYPSETTLYRLMRSHIRGDKAGSGVVPYTDMKPAVLACTVAIRRLPDDLFDIYGRKYWDKERISRIRHNELLMFVAGIIRK